MWRLFMEWRNQLWDNIRTQETSFLGGRYQQLVFLFNDNSCLYFNRQIKCKEPIKFSLPYYSSDDWNWHRMMRYVKVAPISYLNLETWNRDCGFEKEKLNFNGLTEGKSPRWIWKHPAAVTLGRAWETSMIRKLSWFCSLSLVRGGMWRNVFVIFTACMSFLNKHSKVKVIL